MSGRLVRWLLARAWIDRLQNNSTFNAIATLGYWLALYGTIVATVIYLAVQLGEYLWGELG